MTAVQGPEAARWWLDPIVVLLAVTGVLMGTYLGETGTSQDIDERLFRSTLEHMREGDGYYDAFAQAIIEKSGVGPSQVRSVRTPVVSELLAPLPASTWRWVAVVPAMALCLAAAALAGPHLLDRRVAAGIAALWMVVSLPLLYLHAELWGAALFAFGALQVQRDRDRAAAGLCLAATAVRELFAIGLVVGLVVRRDRRPWALAVVGAVVGAALHARWAQHIVDPDGFDPPLRAVEHYLAYLSPGTSGAAQVLGAALLLLAGAGGWLLRKRAGVLFLALCAVPMIVATALTGRLYWTLTWCAISSAAGGVAVGALARRLGLGSGHDGATALAPYPQS